MNPTPVVYAPFMQAGATVAVVSGTRMWDRRSEAPDHKGWGWEQARPLPLETGTPRLRHIDGVSGSKQPPSYAAGGIAMQPERSPW